jgi:hypothetical protein
MWEPPTTIQTSILLGQQTPRGERRHNSYTATRGKPTQALANQRLQLQLRPQLARTQPSGNGIKYGPQQAKVSQSTSTIPLSTRERHTSSSVPVQPAERSDRQYHQQAPPSTGVHHGTSPHWRGQQLYAPYTVGPTCVDNTLSQLTAHSNATHRKPPTLPTLRSGAVVRLPDELPSADSPPTRTAWKTLLHQKRPFSGPLYGALFRTSVPTSAPPVSPLPYGLSPASTARNHRAAVRKTPATHTALLRASKLLSLQ